MSVFIRSAVPEDYQRLFDLWHQIDRYHSDALPERFRAPEGAPRDELYFLSVLEEGCILLAWEGEELVGAAQVVPHDTEDINIVVPRRFAQVEMLVVDHAHHSQGIGRELMLACEEWARSRGLAEVELTVFEFNDPAIHLYESIGYRPYSRKMHKRLD